MEKRNPTQSPLPPLIDFLQIYTIHEYIYIHMYVYVIYIFGDPFGGALTRADNDPRGRKQKPKLKHRNTERAGKTKTETGCVFHCQG